MALKLENNIGSKFNLTHANNAGEINLTSKDLTSTAYSVETIEELSTVPVEFNTVIVKDLDRGGIFIYDSTKVAEDNGGTNFNGWIRQYSGAINVKWFGYLSNQVLQSSITDDCSDPIDLLGETVEFDEMPYLNSYFNGVIKVGNKNYHKPKQSRNYLPQGTFNYFENKSSSVKLSSKRIPVKSGWSCASLTGSSAFIISDTETGVRIFNTSNIINDKVVLVANLTPSQTSPLKGQGVVIKTNCRFGSGFNPNSAVIKVMGSDRIGQPITNLNGTYSNRNQVLASDAFKSSLDLRLRIPNIIRQIAVVIELDFDSGTSDNFVDIDFVGIGLNHTISQDSALVDSSPNMYLASTQSKQNPKSINKGGAVFQVAQTANNLLNRIVYPVRHNIDLPYNVEVYSTLGTKLKLFNETTQENVNCFVEHIGQKGFMIRNNQDIPVGDLYSFHYLAEGWL